VLLDCQAPPAVLRARVAARQGDASEADVAVLEQLRAVAEPLADDERVHTIAVDTTRPFDAVATNAAWRG
jgi:predicted kinase